MYELFIKLCSSIGYSSNYVDNVLKQLRSLNITELINEGSIEFIGGLKLLGKGQNSFVLKCRVSNLEGYYACKIRRPDSPRPSLINEARNLKLANEVNVGPLLINHTNDVIVMEYINGVPLGVYLNQANHDSIKAVVKDLLMQGFRLDSIGLIHSELSRIREHVIISNRVYIIDFESASVFTKSITNVTQLVSALILSKGALQAKVRNALNLQDTNALIKLLRLYKVKPSHDSFNLILRSLGLLN
ncbi:RIO1 family regulatory kinase/ATPase [Caldivirga maquilingensis]|uniref:non-specific serine/threonine protein kinase n=1 Tax=Caldivirga maquilingensis (strain ATCC 700844 / DSM 13496 / JCM 10307 / IC-167) TaxID=397948 RepID=A8MDC9_CALMQ|nr:RIO1 family regulatory kinase/ATPase [Caldivirga maquilingensis]ABW01785.1 Ser/Thr protein kinase-like protein [Caldivirga maquilingensis IC-167]